MLSNSTEAESGWGAVLGDQGLYTCLHGAVEMENGVAGAGPGPEVLPMVALQVRVVSLGDQVRGIAGLSMNT